MIIRSAAFLGRSNDRSGVASLIERALKPYAEAADTRSAALVAIVSTS